VCNTDFYLKKFLTPLILALEERGYKVECLTEGRKSIQHLQELGIRVHSFHFPPKASLWQFMLAIKQMGKVLQEGDYHIVNGHNRNSSIVTRVASALVGVPINLYTAHGFYYHDNQSAVVNKLTEIFEGLLAKITTYTLSQSDEDTIRMIQKRWIRPDQIRTIGNGIDADRFTPKGDDRQSSKFRISASGRMVAGKGFEDILRALSQATHRENMELLFIGGNIPQDLAPSADAFSSLISSLGLEKQVKTTGMIENVEDYLNEADVFIHPSYVEGMPRSLLEAMSVGLPCVATRIRGAREIITDGVNGFLYEAHDYDQLADLIDKLYEDELLREKIGKIARETVLDRFQEAEYIERQVQAMEDLLRMKGFIK
jgi:glycosyltransferase involved in cell wall biosynthesis